MQSPPGRQRATFPLLVSLATLLLLAVLATRGRSAVPRGRGLVFPSEPALGVDQAPVRLPPPVPLNPVLGIGLSSTIAIALVGLLLCLGALLVVLASIRLRRRRLELERASDHGDQAVGGDGEMVGNLLRGTRSALRRLQQRVGGPPGDAVQEAWLALEAAAAGCGTARRPDQTPTEFTGAVLAAHDVDPVALATLRGLYQRARFGVPDSVTEADAATAITALGRIADTLAGVR